MKVRFYLDLLPGYTSSPASLCPTTQPGKKMPGYTRVSFDLDLPVKLQQGHNVDHHIEGVEVKTSTPSPEELRRAYAPMAASMNVSVDQLLDEMQRERDHDYDEAERILKACRHGFVRPDTLDRDMPMIVEHRHCRTFLWLPKTINGETRWLSTEEWIEEPYPKIEYPPEGHMQIVEKYRAKEWV